MSHVHGNLGRPEDIVWWPLANEGGGFGKMYHEWSLFASE